MRPLADRGEDALAGDSGDLTVARDAVRQWGEGWTSW